MHKNLEGLVILTLEVDDVTAQYNYTENSLSEHSGQAF